MQVDVGIIGGTGVGDRLLRLGGKPLFVPTEAGMLRGRLIEHEGVSILLVSRHSAGHKVPPHKVNYHAMALGMKALGAKACLASAAVGSLRREWGPGTLVACSDFLDLTFRNFTIFDRKVVHTDFLQPFAPRVREAILASPNIVDGGVYVCLNGPRYESPAEIRFYEGLGGDLVGMTAATEAILMREAGVDYGTLAIVTNLASGYTDQPLSHEEVVVEMNRSGEAATNALLSAAVSLAKNP
jgi:5'-methylthioadenosine phosphorylase